MIEDPTEPMVIYRRLTENPADGPYEDVAVPAATFDEAALTPLPEGIGRGALRMTRSELDKKYPRMRRQAKP